jgi:hypothetical protein
VTRRRSEPPAIAGDFTVQKFKETKILSNPNFWFCYLVSSFGQIGESLETDFVGKIFNINEENTIEWWNSFTGYYEGIFDETDGEVENPNAISIEFQNQVNLVIEFHAGDTYYSLENLSSKQIANLGSIGGHWILPMLRWIEVLSLSQKVKLDSSSENYSNLVTLLMLPCVWLTKDEDFEEARKVLAEAWIDTGLVTQENAELLALKCCEAIDARKEDFYWLLDNENNWVTNAHWSSRFSDESNQNAKSVTKLLNLATNN